MNSNDLKAKAIYLISLLLFLSACKTEKEEALAMNHNIVLCFDHYAPRPYRTPGAGFFHIPMPLVAYVDSTEKYVECVPDIYSDTIIIRSPKATQELALSYRNFEYIYYQLFQGDTITISMDSLDYPLLKSKHFPAHDRIYNMNYHLRKGRTHSGLEAKTCLGSDFASIALKIDYILTQEWGRKFIKDYCPIDSMNAMFLSYKEAYTDTIDSYKNQQLISEELHDHYRFLLRLKDYESQRILNKDSAYYKLMEQDISDKYACHPSYYEFLDYYLWFFNYHIKKVRKSQGTCSDWRQTFDELSIKPFQPKSMQLLLQRCVKEIGDNFSAKDLNNYLDDYARITGDSVFYNKTVRQYNLSADADQLLLKDVAGNRITFRQLLELYKGKVLYIDFWASWCMPCREEMKASVGLRKQYEGKDVVFIYLAYKDTEGSWKKAVMQENLSDVSTNYFIENSKNSRFLEELKLELIPRYLIVNKAGEIADPSAPRPSDQQITTVLNEYLYENTSGNHKR